MWTTLLLACAAPIDPADRRTDPVVTAPTDARPNLLVLVLDEVGADAWARTGGAASDPYPATPHLDALADAGVLFRNAWSNPTCTPSRVAALTGRWPYRTGAGSAVAVPAGWHLAPGTPTVAGALSEVGYATAAFGKWHLGERMVGGWPVPDEGWGFDHTAGTIANLGPDGNPWADPWAGYYHYLRHENGQAAWVWGYATTRTVDDALDWIGTAPEPWFSWVAFHAAHAPFQSPPPHLVTSPLAVGSADPAIYRAMIEALDAEIGRLLDGLDDAVRARTTVVAFGDNGIPFTLVPPALATRVKGSTFEGGIHVPLVVAGAGVTEPGRESAALVSMVDLAALWVALGRAELPGADGVDFSASLTDPSASSARTYAYAEQFQPNFAPGFPPTAFDSGAVALRDARFKLRRGFVLHQALPDELYDLAADPFETVNLLEAPSDEDILTAARLADELTSHYPGIAAAQ